MNVKEVRDGCFFSFSVCFFFAFYRSVTLCEIQYVSPKIGALRAYPWIKRKEVLDGDRACAVFLGKNMTKNYIVYKHLLYVMAESGVCMRVCALMWYKDKLP